MTGMIGELFAREPRQWGLRGDPWLWAALRDRFARTVLPASRGALEAAVRMAIAQEIGVPVTSPHADAVFVERFAHGGMCSGRVFLPWWRDTALPKLVRRAGVPGAQFSVRTTTEDDWERIRALRIENATENPISYGATLDTTLRMTEDDWRLRGRRGASAGATSLAAIDARSGKWIGMMSAQEEGDGAGCLLTGVFVSPAFRGRQHGVTDALLGEIRAWAVHRATPMRLWVDEGAAGVPARRFYERQGFVPSGARRPIGFADGDIIEMVDRPD